MRRDGVIRLDLDGQSFVVRVECPLPRLTECQRDVLRTLQDAHPSRLTTDRLFARMEASGRIHGLSTVKAALSKLRRAGLIANDMDHSGYHLTDAGLMLANAQNPC